MDLWCKRFLVSPVVCVVLNINWAALGDTGVRPGTSFPFSARSPEHHLQGY